jgi:SAM-dependent MidA family methyltransferase
MESRSEAVGDGDAARVDRLHRRLAASADPGGFVPFDRFMEIALYDPADGYYSTARSPLGPHGDFYTAAHVAPLFARALAQRVRAIRSELGAPREFRIVELGPGDGTLGAGLAGALRSDPDGLEYVLVERSNARAHDAEERIRAKAGSIPVRRTASVGEDGPFAGAVIANEYLDAQPARRLLWDGARWKELGVQVRPEGLAPSEADQVRPVPGPPLPVPPEPGTVVEVSAAAEAVVREIGDHLDRGAAVLIDYGLEEAELLVGHPRGTLAAVRSHRSLDGPLDAPGTSDLSTFVNFTRLRSVARASGLAELSFRSQAEALGAWGFPELLDAALRSAGSTEAEVRLRLAAKNLLFGFENFRVLELAPGPRPAR